MSDTPKGTYQRELEKAQKIIEDLKERGVPEEEWEENVRREVTQAAVLSHLFKKPGKAFAKVQDDEGVQAAIAGPQGRREGYLAEQKELIRKVFSRNRELIEFTNDLGLTVLLAALSKTGLTAEGFQKIFQGKENLRDSLNKAGDFCFTAIDTYGTDVVMKLEKDRDTARGQVIVLEQLISKARQEFDPAYRLELMITNLILSSGTTQIDPQALDILVDKWVRLMMENETAKALNMVVPT